MDLKSQTNEIEFNKYKNKVVNDLKLFIDNLQTVDYKRAAILTYWLNDYINYLKNEKKFKPEYLPVFKRGCIVEINLGYRIGTEYGGVHYGIVLNKKDKVNNPNLTILPLSSKKENKKIHYSEFDLGDEFYNVFLNKVNTLDAISKQRLQNLSIEQKDIIKNIKNIDKTAIKLLSNLTDIEKLNITENINDFKYYVVVEKLTEFLKTTDDINIITKIINCLKKLDKLKKDIDFQDNRLKCLIKKTKIAEKDDELLNLCNEKLINLKKGSIVKINQITTINKARVKDPINPQTPLYDVLISDETMNKIDEKFKKFF